MLLVGSIIELVSGACPSVATLTACIYEAPTVWEIVESMTAEKVAGLLALAGLFVVLLTIGVLRSRAIYWATKQTRAYKSRVLTALFYGQAEEAIAVGAQFPRSPVACVVRASFQPSAIGSLSPFEFMNPLKSAFNRTVVAQTIRLKRWLWMIEAIGWCSPIIGLITTLIPSSHYGPGPDLPFFFGLMIAVPALCLHKGLSAQVDYLL